LYLVILSFPPKWLECTFRQ